MIGRSQKEEALKVRVVKANESSEKEKVICSALMLYWSFLSATTELR